jgi:transposase-like protein
MIENCNDTINRVPKPTSDKQNELIKEILLLLEESLGAIPENKATIIVQKAGQLLDLLPSYIRAELDGKLQRIGAQVKKQGSVPVEMQYRRNEEDKKKGWVRIQCPACGSYNVTAKRFYPGVNMDLPQSEFKCWDCKHTWKALQEMQKVVGTLKPEAETVVKETIADTKSKELSPKEAPKITLHDPIAKSKAVEAKPASKPMIKCPGCGSILEIHVTSCPSCKESLLPDQCPGCLKILKEGFKFCPYCTLRLAKCDVCKRYIVFESKTCKYCVLKVT